MKIKVLLADIKKAIGWLEANTNEAYLNLELDGEKLLIRCTDRYDTIVEIELYSDQTQLLPKIRKTNLLGDK